MEMKRGILYFYDADKQYGLTQDKVTVFASDIVNFSDYDVNTFENKYEIEYEEVVEEAGGSPCAKNATIVQELPSPFEYVGTQSGYIINYSESRKQGYIVSGNEHTKKTRGDVVFLKKYIVGEYEFDAPAFHYKVTYDLYAYDNKRIAKNIQVLGKENGHKVGVKKEEEQVSLLFPNQSEIVSFKSIKFANGVSTMEETINVADLSDDTEMQYGLVFYYIQNKTAYIVNEYINPNCRSEQQMKFAWSIPFIPQQTKIELNDVGKISTGRYVYLVGFKEKDGVVDEVTLLAKAVKKRVVSLNVERDASARTHIKLLYQKENATPAATPAPAVVDESTVHEGTSLLSSLNSMVDLRLRGGNVNQCISCLKLIKSHKNDILPEEYYGLRMRLLPMIYKGTNDDKYRKEIITCCTELLKYTQKDTYKLKLYLDRAKKQLQGGEYAEATNSFKAWLDLHKQIIEKSPEREAGLQLEYDQVLRGLKKCESSSDSPEMEATDEANEERRESLLEEIYDVVEKQAEGKYLDDVWKKLEQYEELSAEETKELDEMLRSEDFTKYPDIKLWPLAKVYGNLLSSEKYMNDMSKLAIYTHIVKNAFINRALYASDGHQKQYYMLMSTFNNEELSTESISAIIGASYMQNDDLHNALDGGIDLEDVITGGLSSDKADGVIRGMIEVSAQNEYIKDIINETLYNIELNHPDQYKQEFRQYTGFTDGSNEGEGLAECLEQAIAHYISLRESFERITPNGTISAIAHQYREVLNGHEIESWIAGEPITRDEIRDVFIAIDNYDSYRGFPEKSGQIKKASESIQRILNKIQNKPSVFICDVYKRMLEKYYQILLSAYQKLCKTSRPILQIGEPKLENEKGQYRIHIPIIPGKNYAQDARDVVLLIRNQEGVESDKAVTVSPQIPSDGNVVWAEVPLKLTPDSKKDASIEVQIRYEYISDIDIRTKQVWGKKYKKFVQSSEVVSKGFYPSDIEFKKIEFLLGQSVEKHPINTDRLKKFPKDGAKVDLNDPGIKKILENREKIIQQSINGLTVNDNEDELSLFGRWVILHGQWRVGKSLILKCIEEYLSNKERFPHSLIVSMNCTTGDTDDFENVLAGAIYMEIAKHVRKTEYQPVFEEVSQELGISRAKKPDWDEVTEFLELFIGDLRDEYPDFTIVILLDEFTNIYEAIIRGNVKERFPARWTDLINKTNVLCVTAGGEHTVSLMTTYSPNTIQKSDVNIFVTYLMLEDVDTYVRYIMGESPADQISPEESYFGVKSKEAIERIYELTGGNAYILQRYCTWLIEYMNEKHAQLLSKHVVDSVLTYLVEEVGMDMVSVENDLFNSLYNPFNETEGTQYLTEVKRIEDDKVKDDNLQILRGIVALASNSNHMCAYTELEEAMKNRMKEDVFRRRYKTLEQRGIIKNYGNGNIKIFIDLYYEIVSRLERVK